VFNGYCGVYMSATDVESRAAAATTAAAETEAQEKFDVTSPQDETRAASSPLLGPATSDLEMPDTICRPTSCFCVRQILCTNL